MVKAHRNLSDIPRERTPMEERAPGVRVRDFSEVSRGYKLEQALNEAERCLECRRPGCVPGCPVLIDIPGFIARIRGKDFRGAYEVLSRSTLLPAVCGAAIGTATSTSTTTSCPRRVASTALRAASASASARRTRAAALVFASQVSLSQVRGC